MNKRFQANRATIGIDSPFNVTVQSKTGLRLRMYGYFLLMDVASIFGGFLVASLFINSSKSFIEGLSSATIFAVIYLFGAFSGNLYNRTALETPRRNFYKAVNYFLIATLSTGLILVVARPPSFLFDIRHILGAGFAAIPFALFRHFYAQYITSLPIGVVLNTLLIVDDEDVGFHGAEHYTHMDKIGISLQLDNPGMLEAIGVLIANFDRVVVSCSRERRPSWTLLLRAANIQGEFVETTPHAEEVIGVAEFCGWPTRVVSEGPLNLADRAKKRMLDLALTVPLLVILAPLLAITAIAIKLESRGPVLFRQDRLGRGNRLFKILKFRSMRVEDSDERGDRSTSRYDERITRVGRFIRKTSIDELPQLINVLLGDMSLVGPRPHALGSTAEEKLFWQIDKRYWLRHALKPGITGLAQVRGFRGATESKTDLTDRLAADLEYLNNWNMVAEIGILFRTVAVLFHRNAY